MLLVAIIGCALTLYLLSQGAPYVPTRRKDALTALKIMGLPKGATIVDVGAGDGAVVKIAAEQGYDAVGIELNPILWLVAKMRTRRYRKQVRIVLGNAWRWELPPETKGVFLFTAGPFAARMQAWLRAEQERLEKPLTVVSLGFPLPNETAVAQDGACIKYVLK